ncbi:MAG TPA: four helix bundle protein [Chthoniobacterales bacterium]|nr:four helix bundle protein [Chthoniobacterales bacterium]
MSDFVYSFEKLRVWNDARVLHKGVYETTHQFPRSEMFGFTSQMNRAAASVATNLAEGSPRTSRKDQAHFTQISYGSLTELACLGILAKDVGLLSKTTEQSFRNQIDAIARQLIALRQSQLRD